MRMWYGATLTMSMHERVGVYNSACVPMLAYIEELCIDEMYFRAAEWLE